MNNFKHNQTKAQQNHVRVFMRYIVFTTLVTEELGNGDVCNNNTNIL